MARFLRFCTLVLALGPGLLVTVRAGCVEDCNACAANEYPSLNLKVSATLPCTRKGYDPFQFLEFAPKSPQF